MTGGVVPAAGEVLRRELGSGTGQVGVHRVLQTVEPVDPRVVPGELAVELASRVLPEEPIDGVRIGVRDALGQHGPFVGREDLAALHRVLRAYLPGRVRWLSRDPVRREDLDIRDLGEQ